MRRLVVLALLLQAGCSFLFVDGPPSRHRELPSFDCTEGYLWPIIDVAYAVGGVAGAIGSLQAEDGTARGSGVAGTLLTTALFAASGIWGWSAVSRCRDAVEEHERRPIEPIPSGPSPSTPPRPPPPGELPPGWKR
jgi:hypothetical protein